MNLFTEDVLSSVEHQPADFKVGRMNGTDIDNIDIWIIGKTLVTFCK